MGWPLLDALGSSGVPAHIQLTAATSMMPRKADMVVGRCAQCRRWLHQHAPSPWHATPFQRPGVLLYSMCSSHWGLHALLITSSEMMVGTQSTASPAFSWWLCGLKRLDTDAGTPCEPVPLACRRWPLASSTCPWAA